jgi:predicted nuclease of predicted toxin-antitoxin system
MRFLADAGISPETANYLRQLGHDAIHVRELGLQRAADDELVKLARAQDRIVLAFDLDFGEILALGVLDRPSVILLRLSDETAASVNRRLSAVLAEQQSALERGALVLVEDVRYRVRALPLGR